MTLRVFHRQPDLPTGTEIELSADESHYLVRVRRARVGDRIDVLDTADVREAVVLTVDPKAARVRLEAARPSPHVAPVTLGLGLPDPKATLEAITLACEAGVEDIALVRCEHSHHAVPSASRIERVVESAQRQCGRPRAPRVDGPVDLEPWLSTEDARPGVVATARRPPAGSPVDFSAGARILVGPEAGLSARDLDAALAAGFAPLSLGPWILRTPTAAAIAVARILATSGP
jgi:16S rRNA (uracil1498-N3)-methyltransferase